MGRWDYTEAFPLGNRKLNVVICIYQKMGYSRKNRINEMLEAIQTDLKKKLTCYEKVQTAYVYEAPLLTVKKFEKLTEETPVYYQRPCEGEEIHSLAHVMFMGLALLEQLQNLNTEENQLYLVTDEQNFDMVQVQELVYTDRWGNVKLNPRFSHISFTPILYKAGSTGNGMLEKFFKEIRSY